MKDIERAARVTLDQWRALVAVVDAGSYAAAAERLHKSQSSVTHAVQRIAEQLDVVLFRREGRRAVLTEPGGVLVRRARQLLDEAGRLERLAGALAAGEPAELRLAVEIIYPTWQLLEILAEFGEMHPDTRIELHESVLGGTQELIERGDVDLAIGSRVPPGFVGERLMDMEFLCCAAPSHPLHRLGRELTLDDLRRHRHLLVRDTGSRRRAGVRGLEAEQRWTVSHKATSIRAACMGLGFAWFAASNIRDELESGELVPLPLGPVGVRTGTLFLIHPDPDAASSSMQALMQGFRARI
ncbi:LysR family transcriptional regulator [Wenzhouxiangella sp. XN79A]|uniref:LysR family transcriptional regulator n=1 Tax=Wenzhouxiangella sp. XN79A TaxID=2724193 RepID=UPI00144A930F|nr:LysR family transcriptional regulator [Wenzhouxiangella sp. XN79A]NKI34422.1 LysR family transcriptional regulator [Wenzhouxiangella sp. XN79A]